MNLRICLQYRININKSGVVPYIFLKAIEHLLIYASIKNGIELSLLNVLVNVRVVLSACNIMRGALFCIRNDNNNKKKKNSYIAPIQ